MHFLAYPTLRAWGLFIDANTLKPRFIVIVTAALSVSYKAAFFKQEVSTRVTSFGCFGLAAWVMQ